LDMALEGMAHFHRSEEDRRDVYYRRLAYVLPRRARCRDDLAAAGHVRRGFTGLSFGRALPADLHCARRHYGVFCHHGFPFRSVELCPAAPDRCPRPCLSLFKLPWILALCG